MIKLKGFGKRYGSNVLLNNVDVEFPESGISFIMGPNGCGKTSLIKCIANLETGEGEILDENNNAFQIKDSSGMIIWDDTPFYDDISGLHNLDIFSEGLFPSKKISEMATKYIPIEVLKRRVKTYSYGQRKKLALCLVRLLNPQIIIMDEITNGLDFEAIRALKTELIELAEKKSLIMTGHQLPFYNNIIDRLYLIKNSKMVLLTDDFKNADHSLEEIYEKEISAD